MNAPATDACGMINTSKEVFEFNASRGHELFHSCGEDQIVDYYDEVLMDLQTKD